MSEDFRYLLSLCSASSLVGGFALQGRLANADNCVLGPLFAAVLGIAILTAITQLILFFIAVYDPRLITLDKINVIFLCNIAVLILAATTLIVGYAIWYGSSALN